MRVAHLFAGAGGGILASEILGHESVLAVELEPSRCAIKEANIMTYIISARTPGAIVAAPVVAAKLADAKKIFITQLRREGRRVWGVWGEWGGK